MVPIDLVILADLEGWSVQFPWLTDLVASILALAIIAFFVYMLRPAIGGTAADFTIFVDDDDVTFQGNFPASMQSMVIDFLRRDCQIRGTYQVKGRWDEGRLVVIVNGEQARPAEQRIRNFLKLNLKPPRL